MMLTLSRWQEWSFPRSMTAPAAMPATKDRVPDKKKSSPPNECDCWQQCRKPDATKHFMYR
jgi:hypothetical protein